MNKYLYAESTQDFWPSIKSVSAISFNSAVEKVINDYALELDDDSILNFDKWDELRNYLNEKYFIDLSDLDDCEEL